MRLGYANRTRQRSERVVDPWGLVDKDDIWYLVTDEPAHRPADFDLSRAWGEVVEHVARQRSLTWATVLVHAAQAWVLRGQFGRHCEVEATLEDGRTRVRLAAPTPLMIAQHLAGWGAAIEVLGPLPLRAELARIGAELTGRYADGSTAGAAPD